MKKVLLLCLVLCIGTTIKAASWSYPKSAIEDPTGTTNTELRDGSKEKPYTIKKSLQMITPYFLLISITWILIVVGWYILGLPIGPGVTPNI